MLVVFLCHDFGGFVGRRMWESSVGDWWLEGWWCWVLRVFCFVWGWVGHGGWFGVGWPWGVQTARSAVHDEHIDEVGALQVIYIYIYIYTHKRQIKFQTMLSAMHGEQTCESQWNTTKYIHTSNEIMKKLYLYSSMKKIVKMGDEMSCFQIILIYSVFVDCSKVIHYLSNLVDSGWAGRNFEETS